MTAKSPEALAKQREATKQWRARNPAKVAEANRKWWQADPERAKDARRRSVAKYRDKRLVQRKAWEAANKEHVKAKRRERYADRARDFRAKMNQARSERKSRLVELMGGKCTDFGCVPHIAAFEFDHVRAKTVNVSTLLGRPNLWDKAVEEAKQCELVCANCHRIRTASRTGLV